jgi:hypothetical protein
MPFADENRDDWFTKASAKLIYVRTKIDAILPSGSLERKLALIALIAAFFWYVIVTTPERAPFLNAEQYSWATGCSPNIYENPKGHVASFGRKFKILPCGCFQQKYKIKNSYQRGLLPSKGSDGYYRISNDAVELNFLDGKDRWSPLCAIGRRDVNFYLVEEN